MPPNHEHFMDMALEEARLAEAEGNLPVGCVIVRDGQVIARGHNEAASTNDPTAHAETMALRKAGPALGTADLSGCTLYTTLEPCPMCCGAILMARVGTLVMGGRYDPVRGLFGSYAIEKMLELLQGGPRLDVVTGVLEDAGSKIVNDWRQRQSSA